MPAETYTYAALAMRYFFIAAILFILIQMVVQSAGEYRELQRAKRQAAGRYVHYIMFSDPEELHGVRYALQKENSIGHGRLCSIRLYYKGIRARHASIYQNGPAMWFSSKKHGVFYNDRPLEKRVTQMQSGDMVEICGVRFFYYAHGPGEKAAQHE